VLVGVAYLGFWQIAPRLPTDSIGAIIVSTVISVALVIWFTAAFAHVVRRPAALALNALGAVCSIGLVALVLTAGRGNHASASGLAALVLHVWGLQEILIVWLAASVGAMLSLLLRGANMIPPVAAVLALVDIWTVLLGGPVQQALNSNNPATQAVTNALTVRQPTPQASHNGAMPIDIRVGFADFLFIAFFFAAIGRFAPSRASYVRTLWALVAVLVAYMLVVMWKEWNLPALVPMAVVMIAVHWRSFHYERSELYALLYAALFIGLILGLFWYFGRRTSPSAASGQTTGVGKDRSLAVRQALPPPRSMASNAS
jgi:hypothetical protein